MARFYVVAHTNAQQVDHASHPAWDFQPLPLVAQATICLLYDLAYWGFLSAGLSILHLCTTIARECGDHDDPMGPPQSGMFSHNMSRDFLFEAVLRSRLRCNRMDSSTASQPNHFCRIMALSCELRLAAEVAGIKVDLYSF